MIYSMTGYGKGSAENKNLIVETEVKSVNSRYLDILLKLSSSLMNKEYELREFIKSKIKRGKITVLITVKRNGNAFDGIAINKENLKSYLFVLKNIKKTAKLNDKIKLDHLLINKELFESSDLDIYEEGFNLIKKALDVALNNLIKMKKNEGKELEKDLNKRIQIIEQKLDEIEKESAGSVNEYFNKLKEKVKLLLEDVNIDNDRLQMELAIIADKAEITEECVRLKSHIKFFKDSLEKGEEPGRKLNFLCQEMNRETNTISSKTISTSITHNTVLIKEEIEKIREQIQNIE